MIELGVRQGSAVVSEITKVYQSEDVLILRVETDTEDVEVLWMGYEGDDGCRQLAFVATDSDDPTIVTVRGFRPRDMPFSLDFAEASQHCVMVGFVSRKKEQIETAWSARL